MTEYELKSQAAQATCTLGLAQNYGAKQTDRKPMKKIEIQQVENGYAVTLYSDFLNAYTLDGSRAKIFVAHNLEDASEIVLREGRKAA